MTVQVLLVHSDDRPFEVERFATAWERAGGRRDELLPVTPSTATESLDGAPSALLLSGGPDVEPARYGATPEEGVTLTVDRARDALDLELLARAEREELPVLAVCYAMQLLNVALGGTLIQDLSRAGRPGHSVEEPKDHLAHEVRLAGGGGRWLAGLPARFAVNSRHHQAIDRLAAGLAAVAVAPDRVVEAVELRDSERLVLGVQWHPENIAGGPHDELFRRFRATVLAAR